MRGIVLASLAMAGVVLLSNFAVQIPINDWFTWGHFTYPFAFLVTDLSNRLLGARRARQVVVAGFVVGVALSVIFADPRIGLASGTAFLMAQMLDVQVFDRLRQSAWWKAPLVSSVAASVLDTALFYSIAFVGSGLPWVNWAITDLGVKLAMAAALLPAFRLLVNALKSDAGAARC